MGPHYEGLKAIRRHITAKKNHVTSVTSVKYNDKYVRLVNRKQVNNCSLINVTSRITLVTFDKLSYQISGHLKQLVLLLIHSQ
jgi:hypothetical protein